MATLLRSRQNCVYLQKKCNMAKPFKPLVDSLPAPLRNKYIVAVILFAVWMIFFDTHNLFTQISLYQTEQSLMDELDHYGYSIEEAWENKRDIEVNREKFAREQFYLKKSSEDVFIIPDE